MTAARTPPRSEPALLGRPFEEGLLAAVQLSLLDEGELVAPPFHHPGVPLPHLVDEALVLALSARHLPRIADVAVARQEPLQGARPGAGLVRQHPGRRGRRREQDRLPLADQTQRLAQHRCLARPRATLITSNLPFDEWTETFGTERLTGALLDRLTHHVNILEMNGDSYRLSQSRARRNSADS